MIYVDLTNTGIVIPTVLGISSPTYSGNAYIIQPETQQVVGKVDFSSVSNSGVSYTITGMHSSLDTYIVAPAAYGYNGEVMLVSGLSPTVEILNENFQYTTTGIIRSSTSSGTELYYEDFESLTITGATATYTGGAPSSSGIQYPVTTMVGSAYLSYGPAASNSALAILPTTTTGITCGRVTFLARAGSSTSSSNQAVGIAFLRNGPAITSSGYSVLYETNSTTQFLITLNVGQIVSTAGSLRTGTAITSRAIEFSSSTLRSNNRNMWISVEWEAFSNYILFKTYYKQYSSGDTARSIRDKMIFIEELVYSGQASGGSLYLTTSESVLYALSTDTSAGVGIDEILVESLQSLPKLHLNQFTIAGINDSGAMRSFITNILNNTGDPPEGTINISAAPLGYTEANFPLTGKYGYNCYGCALGFKGGLSTDKCFAMLKPFEDSSGIKAGVARMCVAIPNQNFSVSSKVGISFLRQGSSMNSNCYFVTFENAGSNDYRLRLRKGTGMSSTSNTTDLSGTVLVTYPSGSSIGYTANTLVWFEVRWKASGILTNIEVYFRTVSTALGWGYDNSPGGLDYRLGSPVISYQDISSPYLTTSEPVLFYMLMGGGLATYPIIRQCELRRTKIGN